MTGSKISLHFGQRRRGVSVVSGSRSRARQAEQHTRWKAMRTSLFVRLFGNQVAGVVEEGMHDVAGNGHVDLRAADAGAGHTDDSPGRVRHRAARVTVRHAPRDL